ncbi:MAG: M24 family metallopeptidase C-terminal domain-containing protein, partial [Clostridium sp.]
IREAFWQRGLDFNHGTGHGVGYLSGVHERPNGIRWKIVPERQDSAILEPGMICSDEPGLYFEGEFGVRTENLILCVADEKNKYGQFLRFEFLTFAPIDLEAIDTDFMDEHDLRRLNHYHKEVYAKISPYLTAEEAEWLKHATREISGKRK